MHGIGDSLHERAIVRQLKKAHEVWVMTSWPSAYWDMPDVHLRPLRSPIPWMAKNEARCAALYSSEEPPAGARVIRCAYPWSDAKASSVLAAMAKHCGVELGDFRLPIAPAWRRKAHALIASLQLDRPLLITRPLLSVIGHRSLRSAQAKLARNPDPLAYAELLAGIRGRYFVVSIADALPGHEEVIHPIAVDAEFHHGELDFETVAALTARAALVYTSPCFLTVLAQAVETPLVCVFGGFEGANSFAAGARYSPWLPIEPKGACACWNWGCRHDKTINVTAAAAKIERFIRDNNADIAHARDAEKPAGTAHARAAA
jgi:ADP-heptose:LPS heptosyltransferase